MEVRPEESGSACRSERSNLFSVLYGPRFKTLGSNSSVHLNQSVWIYGKLRISGSAPEYFLISKLGVVRLYLGMARHFAVADNKKI